MSDVLGIEGANYNGGSEEATFVPEDIRLRVKKGAQLLDFAQPGWQQRIEVKELELDDICDCVLGQLYGCFSTGWCNLINHTDYETAEDLGFEAERAIDLTNGDRTAVDEEYRWLEVAWVDEINSRLGS